MNQSRELAAADWSLLSALVDDLLEVPEAARRAWLAARDVPTHLRPFMERMVGQDGTLSLPELPHYSDSTLQGLADAAELDDAAGDVIGHYVLREALGRGGMGTVWLAERADGSLKRQVALKLPHATLATRVLAERFGRERDILASLTHPHIARLYDAGIAEGGRPYLAIEYIAGIPITEAVKARRLSLRQTLDLFLQVLDAVQYAHSQLVVHRDLKPANILVTEGGEARLLDFGIAKLLHQGEAVETELTRVGGRALTPQYAAPEQVTGGAISTATDVYALGVILHELLTGALPYRVTRDTRGALEDAILDAEPTTPSDVLAAQGERARQGAVRGELDAIVLKALKKAPAERYATVAALADDIRRHLRGETVLARPDSMPYRLRKLLWRHRWASAALAAVLLALGAGLGVALWQADIARREARTARAVRDFMQGIFLANSAQQPDPIKARQTTARDLLDIGTSRLDEALADAPEAKLDVLLMLAELYSAVGVFDRTVDLMEKQVALAKAVQGADSNAYIEGLMTLVTALRTQRPDHPRIGELLEEAGQALDARRERNTNRRGVQQALAAEYFAEHEIVRAQGLAHAALDTMRNLVEPDTDTAAVYVRAARVEILAHDCPSTARIAAQGVAEARRSTEQNVAGNGGAVVLGTLLEHQAMAQQCQGEHAAALKLIREAIETSTRSFGAEDVEVIRFRAHLAEWSLNAGDAGTGRDELAAVEQLLALPGSEGRSRLHFEAYAAAGRAFLAAGRAALARQWLERALAAREPLDASLALAQVHRDLAVALAASGATGQAQAALSRAISLRIKSGTPEPWFGAEEQRIATRLKPKSAQV